MITNERILYFQNRVNETLNNHFAHLDPLAKPLIKAMQYAVFNGGKRLRPTLVYLVGAFCGAAWSKLDLAAASVELMHCFSLVHDDLPALDNSDLRRGEPSCHKVFGEATALLVGDALQLESIRLLSQADESLLSCSQKVAMIDTLCTASSSGGMTGGQYWDLNPPSPMTSNIAEQIHLAKTGALFKASAKMALIVANQQDSAVEQGIMTFIEAMGLAYQIKDDLLDVIGSADTLGKATGQDYDKNNANYALHSGVDNAKAKVQQLHHTAQLALANLNGNSDELHSFCDFLLTREH